MKVTEFDHGLILNAPTDGYVRSTGLHMSDLYGSLFKLLDPKRYDKRDANGDPLPFDDQKMEMGTRFEEVLEPAIRRQLFGERPGEFFTQHAATCSLHGSPVQDGTIICACGAGVAYSPDQLFFEEELGLVLGEFKLTWYSSRDCPYDEKFDKWVCQMKAYCYHLGTLLARLFPFWVNGVYPKGWPPSPVFEKGLLLEFTPRELEQNWIRLVKHGQKRGMIPNG